MSMTIPNTLPEWDYPPTKTKQNLVVCSIPRTGSNLLCFTLAQQRNLGVPLEYFNFNHRHLALGKRLGFTFPDDYTQSIGPSTILNYTRTIQRYRTTPNGVFGCKIHWKHFHLLFNTISDQYSLEDFFPMPSLIFMHRKNRVEQAVSLFFAHNSTEWFTNKQLDRAYHAYSYERFLALLNEIHDSEQQWMKYFKKVKHLPILVINYENLIADFKQTILSVYEFLNIVPDSTEFTAPIVKQEHPKKGEYIERFIEEFKSNNK